MWFKTAIVKNFLISFAPISLRSEAEWIQSFISINAYEASDWRALIWIADVSALYWVLFGSKRSIYTWHFWRSSKLNFSIRTCRHGTLYGDDGWKMPFLSTGQTYWLLPILVLQNSQWISTIQYEMCPFDLQHSMEKTGKRKDLKA